MLKKFSKSSLIMLIGGIILIAAVIFGMNMVQQSNQKKELTGKLGEAQTKLAGINFEEQNAQLAKLNQDLEGYAVQNQKTAVDLTYTDDSIETTDTILLTARNNNVNVLSISSTELVTETLVGVLCETRAIAMKVQGTTNDVANFLYSLSTTFPTGILKSTEIRIGDPNPATDETSTPTPTPTPTVNPGTDENTTLEVSFTIYNYKGE